MPVPTPSKAPMTVRVRLSLPAILGVLAVSLLLTFLVNEWVGLASLGVGFVLVTRPFDPFVALLLATGAAAFAAYGERSIQRDLAIVLALSVYAAASFWATWLGRRWTFPWSPFSLALTGLAATTALAVLHGLAARNPVPYIALEFFPLASFAFAFVIGGLELRPADLRIAGWAIAATGVLSAAAGFVSFGTTGIRTGGMAFSPVPGFAALVVLSLVLFDPSRRPRLLPVLVFCVLIAHQVVTFTRGYWFGLLVGVPLICWLYGRRGAGSRARWGKVGSTLGLAGLLLALGAAAALTQPRWAEIVVLLGNRFASSFETKSTPETVSNIARLVEIRTTWRAITASPLIGHGEGATIVVRQFFYTDFAGPQWWIHQGYVMMWFKQGLLGLLALLWVLYAAFRMGLDGASRSEPALAGWCAASAACTLFAAIVGLTNYFFFVVSQSFMLAFLWGVTLTGMRTSFPRIRWRAPRPAAGTRA